MENVLPKYEDFKPVGSMMPDAEAFQAVFDDECLHIVRAIIGGSLDLPNHIIMRDVATYLAILICTKDENQKFDLPEIAEFVKQNLKPLIILVEYLTERVGDAEFNAALSELVQWSKG